MEMWLDDARLAEWFEAVQQRRSSPEPVDDGLEKVPLMRNALTEQHR